MLIQTLFPESGVDRLDECVVRRLPGSTEGELDVVPVCPSVKVLRDELRSVVYLDPFGKTVRSGDAFQCSNDVGP